MGGSHGYHDSTTVEYSSLVSTDAAPPCGSSKDDTSSTGTSSVTRTGKSGTSPPQEAGPFSNTYFGQTIGQYNLSAATVDIIGHSWRGGTRSQYDSAIRGWRAFCLRGEINPTCPSIEDILAYLTHMFEAGMQYNTIAATKSALANIISLPGSSASLHIHCCSDS